MEVLDDAVVCGEQDEDELDDSFLFDPDDYDWADPDDSPVLRFLDDGTYLWPDEPLPPGQYIEESAVREDIEYDDDGFVVNVHLFRAVHLIRRLIAVVTSVVRRSVQCRPRERTSRRAATASRGSPARPRRRSSSRIAPALLGGAS